MPFASKDRRQTRGGTGKGMWRPFGNSAIFACPECGLCFLLSKENTIDDSGKVSNPVKCPDNHCAKRYSLHLTGWTPPQDAETPTLPGSLSNLV